MQFSLLKKSEIIDFVELNITGDAENYIRCDEESYFIQTNVFNIFAGCFERSHHLFDYISPVMYNARRFIPLRNELLANLEQLLVIKNVAQFQNYLSQIFLGNDLLEVLASIDPDYEKHWKGYIRRLIQVNRHIMRLIDQCIDEERVLWVIPY
jgi:hypothetical protein